MHRLPVFLLARLAAVSLLAAVAFLPGIVRTAYRADLPAPGGGLGDGGLALIDRSSSFSLNLAAFHDATYNLFPTLQLTGPE